MSTAPRNQRSVLDMDREITELRRERKNLVSENASLKAENAKVKKAYESAATSNVTLIQKVASLKADVESVRRACKTEAESGDKVRAALTVEQERLKRLGLLLMDLVGVVLREPGALKHMKATRQLFDSARAEVKAALQEGGE